jgi:hypothetical protein
MPTVPGIMLQPGNLSVSTNWVDVGGNELAGLDQGAAMRGHPGALSVSQRRIVPQVRTTPQPTHFFTTSRNFSRGADAHAPHFGRLHYNPIGAGVYAPYRIPTIAGPGARYQAAAIWFDVQSVPTGLRINPTVPIETVNALIATSHASATYLTTG